MYNIHVGAAIGRPRTTGAVVPTTYNIHVGAAIDRPRTTGAVVPTKYNIHVGAAIGRPRTTGDGRPYEAVPGRAMRAPTTYFYKNFKKSLDRMYLFMYYCTISLIQYANGGDVFELEFCQ